MAPIDQKQVDAMSSPTLTTFAHYGSIDDDQKEVHKGNHHDGNAIINNDRRLNGGGDGEHGPILKPPRRKDDERITITKPIAASMAILAGILGVVQTGVNTSLCRELFSNPLAACATCECEK